MSNNQKSEIDIAMAKAKMALLIHPNSVFFTTLCFSLKHKFDDSIGTAGTDGETILYSPEFFLSLTQDERVFLMLHETMHCAYMHMFRMKELGLDFHKANIAADHVINLQLLERGFTMPVIGLADPQYKGMSMEQVYKLLPDNQTCPMPDLMLPKGDPQTGKDKSNGSDGSGGAAMQARYAEIQQNMQDILLRAALQSKMANDQPGTIPGELEIFLNNLLNPKLPWTVILRRYLQKFTKKGFTWKKPNRRLAPDFYLPSMRSHCLTEIAIAVDTSGSVTDEQFQQFVSETASIFKMVKPPVITFIQFDVGIRAINKIKSIKDLMNIKFTGRGGTKIDEVIEWAEENKPQLLLVFTDGEFNMPEYSKPPETLWMIHSNKNWKAPFGKVIYYDL